MSRSTIMSAFDDYLNECNRTLNIVGNTLPITSVLRTTIGLTEIRKDFVYDNFERYSDHQLLKIHEQLTRTTTLLRSWNQGARDDNSLTILKSEIEILDTKIEHYINAISNNENSNYDNQELNRRIEEIISGSGTLIKSKIEEVNKQEADFNAEKSKLLTEINKLKKETEDDSKQITQLKNSVEAELNSLKDTYKTDIEQFELISQTVNFATASTTAEKESKFWRNWIVVLTLILIGATFHFLFSKWYLTETPSPAQISKLPIDIVKAGFYYTMFSKALLKLFILSIIIYLLKFSIRNYNALKHNSTVNSHKANCFGATLRIMTAMPEDKSREAILTEAGKEIFVQHKTGYLGKEDSKIDLNLLEKLSGIIQSK